MRHRNQPGVRRCHNGQLAMTIALELARHHHHHVDNSGWGAIAVLMIIVAIAGIITAKDKRNK